MAKTRTTAEKTDHIGEVLSVLGKATQKPVPAPNKFQSRFFFVLDEEVIETRKKAFKPKVLEHVDAHIEKMLQDYKPTATPAIASNIDTVRSFFLKEIAPIMLAASAGAKQAHEVVERLVDEKVDQTLSNNFDGMVMRAARLKLAKFVATLFGLPEVVADELQAIPKPDNPERKLTALIEDLTKMVESQSKGINVLTNRMSTHEKLLRRKTAE